MVGSKYCDLVKRLYLISIRFLGQAVTQHYKYYRYEVGNCLINYFFLSGLLSFCHFLSFPPSVLLIQNIKSIDVESFNIMTVF